MLEEGRALLERLSNEWNISLNSVYGLLQALQVTNFSQASFCIPELGGQGMWMPGMIMIGDMFNEDLKFKVQSICNTIVLNKNFFMPQQLPQQMHHIQHHIPQQMHQSMQMSPYHHHHHHQQQIHHQQQLHHQQMQLQQRMPQRMPQQLQQIPQQLQQPQIIQQQLQQPHQQLLQQQQQKQQQQLQQQQLQQQQLQQQQLQQQQQQQQQQQRPKKQVKPRQRKQKQAAPTKQPKQKKASVATLAAGITKNTKSPLAQQLPKQIPPPISSNRATTKKVVDGPNFWPSHFGDPTMSGSQKENSYAVFDKAHRLVLKNSNNGMIKTYDIEPYEITGVKHSFGHLIFDLSNGESATVTNFRKLM